MKFKNDSKLKKKFQSIIENIEKKLNHVDSEFVNEYIDWLDKKTTYFKQTYARSGYGPQPDDLQRGDIVWVEFGINVGTELSDHQTRGHYAIVWAVDLGNVIVIPLSSRPSVGSNLTYDIGVIDKLVTKDQNPSFLKLDAIRSISKRRIGRMPGKDGGKIRIDDEKIKLISDLIRKSFVD
ncbi:TPA: type II toxin-antitoxin system PemK/MazF family toxin [bacterium]|nr:type II toxin-antitoxin system PemK/MazF family toxin [bacterium]